MVVLKKGPRWIKSYFQRLKNKAFLDVYTSCDTLPAWRFFKILNSGELRYLVDSKRIAEYFHYLLEPIWDDILIEYDRINNVQLFTNAFKDFFADIQDKNELIIMRACYDLLNIGSEKGISPLEDLGIIITEINPKSIDFVRRKIAQFETKLTINALSEEKGEKTDNNYLKSIVQMSNILGRTIDKNGISVTEWVFLNKECAEIVKAKSTTNGWDN